MAESIRSFNPPGPQPAAHNVPEYTVSEISGAVKRMVEERFGCVRVRGEISQWKVHTASGHAYFRLKDEGGVLDGVCWRGSVGKLPFKPEDGLEVVATGRVTTYPGKSSYQIVVETMEPAGAGALMALLEKRRAQLAAEGLFEAARKRPLPFLPAVIGIITSPSGAVIRDILHRLGDRFPLRVVLWPVAVQGEGAAEQVAAAIAGLSALTTDGPIPRPDVLIVARGGGSIEDLWAFNEEIVVRAAAACTIPLISAIGHETDTTLIDFVADRRAPTPTAAAEMAVPVREELLVTVSQLHLRLQGGWARLLARHDERLCGLLRGLPKPSTLLEHAAQRLDDWSDRLRASLPQRIERQAQRMAVIAAAFRPQLLQREVETYARRVQELKGRLHLAFTRRLEKHEQRLAAQSQLLESLNYRSVLKRGFALVRTPEGTLVTSAEAACKQPRLHVVFHDGETDVRCAE